MKYKMHGVLRMICDLNLIQRGPDSVPEPGLRVRRQEKWATETTAKLQGRDETQSVGWMRPRGGMSLRNGPQEFLDHIDRMIRDGDSGRDIERWMKQNTDFNFSYASIIRRRNRVRRKKESMKPPMRSSYQESPFTIWANI